QTSPAARLSYGETQAPRQTGSRPSSVQRSAFPRRLHMDESSNTASAQRRGSSTSLKAEGVIKIPGATGSAFDHGIFDPGSGHVFIAHTARSTIEVIDPLAGRHIATLPDFPGAARAVADDGEILVTN